MGCGHSKINIYPRKSKSKTSSKKTVTPEKADSEEEDGIEAEAENTETLEDCDSRKTIKVKPFGGPLLAQIEISTSQQDFFRMLDEKIQNGPDYNSESETEKAAETARLNALLKDWESASAGCRSVPVTPKRRPRTTTTTTIATNTTTNEKLRIDGVRSGELINRDGLSRLPTTQSERNYPSQIPQSVIHQSYGVTQVSYRQINYNNPNYITQSPSHPISYPSALQYQAISPMYTTNQTNYPTTPALRQYANYNQYGSPLKTFINSNNSPKHIPYEQQQSVTNYNSPGHKLYGPVIVPPTTVTTTTNPMYSNGELVQQQQQQLYNQYQQYKDVREQIQNQQQQTGYRRNYQTSVTIPIIPNQQTDVNVLHRKQYELT